jgi:ADP-heptose:LPS heptosyltransferase
MGLGDDIIFLGEAERIHKETGKTIVPLYYSKWNPLYDNVEFISKNVTKNSLTVNARDTDKPSDIHVDYYVKGRENTILGEKLVFRPYKPKRFKLRLTEEEYKIADEKLKNVPKEFMVVNPDCKKTFFSDNKDWGFTAFQAVVNKMYDHIPIVRVVPSDDRVKSGIQPITGPKGIVFEIECSNLRIQAAIWSRAKFGLTFDGLMVHLMAGFNIPVVNIMGGLLDEKVMNYENNINLIYRHAKTPCGSLFWCPHCEEAKSVITIDMVVEACKKLL